MRDADNRGVDRRRLLEGGAAVAAALAAAPALAAAKGAGSGDREAVIAKIPAMHDATVKMIQDWIAVPSVAAENAGFPQGPEYMAKLAREAGFQQVKVMPVSSGKAGVFATLDAGAPTWLAVYLMYDVKQYDPKEWDSPPLEARIVDKPGFGKVIVGRGAENSKGPQAEFLATVKLFQLAGRKLPVNLVLVCEGEEEIASPNFREVVHAPEVLAALKKCVGVVTPMGGQAADGSVEINLGAKGVAELELVSDGATWGRGPKLDVHSSLEAQLDSPAWRLVQALNTLVGPDGHTPAVEGFFDKVRPMTPVEKRILEESIPKRSEAEAKAAYGVTHWYKDESWHDSLVRLASQPTINIEGLVGGYTGTGGKTILPHRAVAKVDMRLVPDMTAKGTVELVKAHLARHGFPDIQVNMSGGYDPTETAPDSRVVKAALEVYRKAGIEPVLWPRSAGSWPGVIFTGAPVNLPAVDFGLSHGGGAHAPNEYWIVDSTNPKVAGLDGALRGYVDFLYAVAETR